MGGLFDIASNRIERASVSTIQKSRLPPLSRHSSPTASMVGLPQEHAVVLLEFIIEHFEQLYHHGEITLRTSNNPLRGVVLRVD
jgi:hypothetical protein